MTQSKPELPYGHLAILKLLQIAGFDHTLGDAAKRVFMILAGYCSHDDYSCYPSASKIAGALGMTHPAITKQIDILAKHGYLKKTPNFCPETRRRKSNILTLNIELARKHHNEPAIFCKRNVISVVTCLVTLGRYMGLQPDEITSSETPKSYRKKAIEVSILKKSWEEIASKKAKIRACAWQQEKERQAKTGITKAHNQNLEALNEELRQHMHTKKLVDFSLSVGKSVKGMAPLDATNLAIKLYEEKLQEVRLGAGV